MGEVILPHLAETLQGEIIDASCETWNRLVALPETITSIGIRKWAHIG